MSRKARKVAVASGAAMLCYSYYASDAFSHPQEVPYRFLFQMHPHPRSVRRLLREELELVPSARASLRNELELSLSEVDFERLAMEPQLANGWVVPSTFNARTLASHGVPLAAIHVVPYGVDGERFPARAPDAIPRGPYTAVYVGSMIQRKGLSYLLDAARSIGSRHINIVLCGRGAIDRGLLARYSDLDLDVRIGMSNAELVRVLHASDVLVLPSLAEGFGHVILEAMSCGLPVIATPNTCAPDVLEDGVQGFIVPIRDSIALEERLTWGLDNREQLVAMGQRASAAARKHSWEEFRRGIRRAYGGMFRAVANADV